MKQRFSSREEEEEEDYDDDDGAAARTRGFSKLVKFMKVTSRRSSSSTPYDYNSLLMRVRLPEQSSSTITELSNQEDVNMSRRTDQEDVNMSRRTDQEDVNMSRRTDQEDVKELSNQEDVNRSRRTDQSMELRNQEQQQQQPTSIRMYTCKTCGRKFGSFQALGGHRASHNMKLVGQGMVGEDGTYQNYFQYKAKLHRCSICGKGYQTGQSLGGHMRKHRELLENQRLAAAAAAASNIVHQQTNNDESNNIALKWAQMNAAAIFQYSNHAQRYYNAPHQAAAEAGVGIGTDAPHQATAEAGVGIGTETEGGTREISREKVQNKRRLNFDLNLDVSENEELGLINDEC